MILSTSNSGIPQRVGYEKATEILKSAGFDAIDMSLGTLEKPDSVFWGDSYKQTALALRDHAKSLGMTFNQSHAPFHFNWANNPNEYEDRFFPAMIRSLEVSALLGCNQAIVHPIHHQEYIGHEEEQFELNMKFYRDLLPYAKEFGVKIALENMWQNEIKRKHPGFDVCSLASEFVRYIDTLDDDYFTACLDLGHSGMVGEEAQDAIRILGHDRLGALHVHDNNYCVDQHTLPFLGKMDFEEIMKALAEIDYKGEFTYEAGKFYIGMPDAMLQPALKFMADMGRYLIDRYEYYRGQI